MQLTIGMTLYKDQAIRGKLQKQVFKRCTCDHYDTMETRLINQEIPTSIGMYSTSESWRFLFLVPFCVRVLRVSRFDSI